MGGVEMQEQAQDAPLWVLVLLAALCALAGEMYRADKNQRITKSLMLRIIVRAFAGMMIGMIALAYCLHQHYDIYASGAIVGVISILGADTVIAIGMVLLKRRINVS